MIRKKDSGREVQDKNCVEIRETDKGRIPESLGPVLPAQVEQNQVVRVERETGDHYGVRLEAVAKVMDRDDGAWF